MTYDQAAMAVRQGLNVTQDGNIGKALKIIVLFGADYIQTDAPCRARNFSVKHASLAEEATQ